MNMFPRALLTVLSTACLATFATAQTVPAGTFKHIVIIVQENRTPDNLFGTRATGGPCTITNPFTGADINNGGFYLNSNNQRTSICNVSQAMNAQANNGVFDPGHQYEDWTSDYDSGNMDNFCHGFTNCTQAPSPYSFIQTSDVQPYFAIATTYGFANYMFQTNEGPSFEAHQFLFTGTSAPVAPNDPSGEYWDFVKDNASFDDSGCTVATGAPALIQPDRSTKSAASGAECYPHDSLMTGSTCPNGICDKYPNLSWRYYSPTPNGIIWNAPEAIPEVCYGENDTTNVPAACGTVNGGAEWVNHMSFYSASHSVPIFTDINACNLANVSWIIPDLAWSDHPFNNVTGPALGPSWVANIVNAIGNSYASSNHQCDYWGTNLPQNQAEPTAIFILWDDWGGFFDHVPPIRYLTGTPNGFGGWNCPAPATNNWGCGYTYGFRVPLLVVSEFTGTKSGSQYSGYISGKCGTTGFPNCPNQNPIYQHDFGSILAFTEHNFGLTIVDQSGDNGYADNNAIDWGTSHSNVPLSDFFPLYTGSGSTGRPFVQIPATSTPSFFATYYTTHSAVPTGPDTD